MIVDIKIQSRLVKVDLDKLSVRGRALAEAIAATPGSHNGDIWMEADKPIRETTPGWEMWFTPVEAAQPERRPWRGWDKRRFTDPVAYIEKEAAKIPPGWHVLGAHPHQPVPTAAEAAATREATSDQVLAYLRERGRVITAATWRSYVGRGQAPAPVRHVGRTPIYDLTAVDSWLARN